MNNFYFTTFKALLTIDHFAKSWENIFPYQGEEFDEEAIFVVSDGNVDFPEHLRLDIDLGWKSNDQKWIKQFPGLQTQKSDELVQGIIIFGNLSVKGSILNYFFKRVCEKYGAFCFSYFPDTFLTQSICEQEIEKKGINLKYIPERLITKDLCYLAAKHETNISSIPTVYLDESLIKEIIHYNDSEMDNVPEQFITEELLVDYVKLGRGLWLDKYCEIAKVSKIAVLLKALDSGIEYIEQIWGFHFRQEVYDYAKKLYDNKQHESAWNKYTEKFQKKIERLS